MEYWHEWESVHRHICRHKSFFLPHWIEIPPRWPVRASHQLLQAFLFRIFKVLHFISKGMVSSKILNLRLFCLERFVTCWAVKAIITLSVLHLITVFTYEREAGCQIPVWTEHKSKHDNKLHLFNNDLMPHTNEKLKCLYFLTKNKFCYQNLSQPFKSSTEL